MEPLNNGHIGGRDFVPCREVVHYRRSTIFLLIISPIITFQWLNESMRVRGFQINRCFHDTLALSMVNIFEHFACVCTKIVAAHRRILGMASFVCVLVKICVSSISLYKLDTDKLTAPFESAHQFNPVCTVSDSKTVPGCHYNLCSNRSFVLTD